MYSRDPIGAGFKAGSFEVENLDQARRNEKRVKLDIPIVDAFSNSFGYQPIPFFAFSRPSFKVMRVGDISGPPWRFYTSFHMRPQIPDTTHLFVESIPALVRRNMTGCRNLSASTNGMVGPCSAPPAANGGTEDKEHAHVTETRRFARRNRHRYRQALVPHRRPRSARCHRAAAEVLAWPGAGPTRQSA